MTDTISKVRVVERKLVGSATSRAAALCKGAMISGVAVGLLLDVLALLVTAVLRPSIAWSPKRRKHVPRHGAGDSGFAGEGTEATSA